MATNTSTPGEHRPLAEATVALYEAEPWDPGQGKPIGDLLMTAQTDPNGEYWLDYHLLPEGPAVTYTLVVSSTLVHAIDVVAPPPANGTAENSIAFPIYTPTGYYPDNQFIVEPNVIPTWRHWSFSGQVVDASTGDPVPGVVMVLYGANNIDEPENVLAGAATDNTGRYQLDASLLESENYQYFVLAVEDYATSAVGATSNSGGVVTGDNRVYFPNPPPDTFPDNNFSVPHNPDEGMQSMALTSGVKNQPVVAMILNYNCSCGTSSDCQHITNT